MAEGEKWIQAARTKMEKKGTIGSLREKAGVSGEKTIPESKLDQLKARAKKTGNTDLMQKVQFAKNVRK